MDAFNKYVGQIFDRRYKIIKIIGVGGMAVVFEAIDMVMKRTVAVKMLREEISNDAQSVKRFINESKAVSMLSHPNIVSIYDVSVKDNLKYIVMELVDGITLKNYMNQKGALPTEELLRYTEQILRALEHAHSKGIIHRDIKPQNIMLLKNGHIKVADFGIAKLPNAETVTMTDKAIGTVFYISPEQASGKKIDPRSDLYSLGVVMYEMATGQLPFTADSPVSVALMQVNKQPRQPRELNPNIPQGLEQLILSAMEKNPDRRLQSARAMLRPVTQLIQNPNTVFRLRRDDTPRSGVLSRTKPLLGKGREGDGTNRGTGRSHRQNRSMLPVIMGVTLAFLLVLGVTGVYMLGIFMESQKDSSVTISIPALSGNVLTDETLGELRKTRYYNITINEIYDPDMTVDLVTEQTPSPGETRKVKPGEQMASLTLTVNRGARKTLMPNLTRILYQKGKIAIGELGMNIQIKEQYEYDDYVPLNYVIRTDPVENSEIVAGDTVTFYISKGAEVVTVSVPDFRGDTVQEAMEKLIEHDLDYGRITYEHSKTVERGHIISQSKIPYSEVPIRVTKIDFVISLGEEGTPVNED